LAVEPTQTLMVRARALASDQHEAEEHLLMDVHEFKAFVKRRVHPDASARTLRQWYRVLDSRHDGSIDPAPFFAFAAREAILRPMRRLRRPEASDRVMDASQAAPSDGVPSTAGMDGTTLGGELGGVASPLGESSQMGSSSPKYGTVTYGALFYAGLSSLRGRQIERKEFLRVADAIGLQESASSRVFSLALAHAELMVRRREEKAVRAIQGAVRLREQVRAAQEQLITEEATERQRPSQTSAVATTSAASQGVPQVEGASSDGARGYRVPDALRSRRPRGGQRDTAQTSRWATLRQSENLSDAIERSLARDLLQRAARKTDRVIDAHALLVALYACGMGAVDGGPLGCILATWLENLSKQTVYESYAGAQRQRLKLIALTSGPDDVPVGTPASALLPDPLPTAEEKEAAEETCEVE